MSYEGHTHWAVKLKSSLPFHMLVYETAKHVSHTCFRWTQADEDVLWQTTIAKAEADAELLS